MRNYALKLNKVEIGLTKNTESLINNKMISEMYDEKIYKNKDLREWPIKKNGSENRFKKSKNIFSL